MDSIDRAGHGEGFYWKISNVAIDHLSSISTWFEFIFEGEGVSSYFPFFFFFFKANGSLAISVCIAKLLQKLGMNFVWGEPWRDKIEVVDREEFLMDFSFFFFFRNSNLNLFDFVLRFFFGIERLI